MLIPQGMAYALIAGLPAIYGLYAALVPLLVYGVFGTSRQLAVGPVAMVSLLVAAGVGPLAGSDEGRYVELALLLALMVGIIQLLLGLARFGFLVNFLSHPVLSGFTSAAALIIGFSQLKHLLGIDLPRSTAIHEIIRSAVFRLAEASAPTMALGFGAIVALLALKRWKPTFPGALSVVVAGTALVGWLSLESRGVRIVGEVPSGLPGLTVPELDGSDLRALFPVALAISLVGFMESIAVAKVYASRKRYGIDASQELVALGLANVAGAAFQSFPVTGGFSRTAVNAQAGARTTIASLVSTGVIALTLLLLTPLFHDLPNAVLAAIVIVAVAGLVDLGEIRFLFRVNRQDLALLLLTFAATLALGIEEGILVGIVASLVLVIHQSSRPHTAIMGRIPGTTLYRNVERYPEAIRSPGIEVIRMDASLYFGNSLFLRERLQRLVRERPKLRAVVLDAYPMNRIDSTGVATLRASIEDLERQGVRLILAGVKGPVMDALRRARIAEHLGSAAFHHEVHGAMEALEGADRGHGTGPPAASGEGGPRRGRPEAHRPA